ncbi:MAG: hypothetical protein ACYDAW_08070 [Acidithiobacillus ferrivorans]
MTNIHPFPKRRAASKPAKRHTHKLDHSAPFYLPSVQGEKVDVLITVIAGCNVFLAADLVSAEKDTRKAMFQDFRGAIQEAGDGIRSHVRHAGTVAHEIDLMHKKVRALLEDR